MGYPLERRKMVMGKIRKLGKDRKVVEIPFSVKDEFKPGDIVIIKKRKKRIN